jgi:DNA repair photolyase
MSIDDKVRRAFEPGASRIQERLKTLELFSDSGIPTYVFIGPMLPHISDKELENLMNSIADKVGRVIVDRLNIKAGNWKAIQETLVKSYPLILPQFKEASKDNSPYFDELKIRVESLLNERAIPYDIVY